MHLAPQQASLCAPPPSAARLAAQHVARAGGMGKQAGGGKGKKYPGAIEDVGVDLLRAPKLVLEDAERQRLDESSDAQFYSTPRMMQHADEAFITAVSRVYSSVLPAGASVLELCASHSSHVPDELQPRLMVGAGMNARELAANPALHQWFVQDLNLQPLLLEQLDSSYDAVLCVNGLHYLTQAEVVVSEASRVLRPGGVFVVAFSPDCFREKAWAGWLSRSMQARSELIKRILQANGFDEPMVLDAAALPATAAAETQVAAAPVSGHSSHSSTGQATEAAQAQHGQVLVAAKPRVWLAGAAQPDTAGSTDMRADNVQDWFHKPGLAGLAEAASAQAHAAEQPALSAGQHAAPGPGSETPNEPQTSARLLEQWHAAYGSLMDDAVELGIPRSAIPSVSPDATPAQLQEAVAHLQAMMASFLSAGL